MKIKNIFTIIVAVVASLLAVSFAFAAAPVVADWYPGIGPAYDYEYQAHYGKMPVVSGPYPQYYLAYDGRAKIGFTHDDYDGFDSFDGYKDLDVFYPETGKVDVIRNSGGVIWSDWEDVPNGTTPFGEHVYGYIPGGGVYRKHYYHEHPTNGDYYYGYAYGYAHDGYYGNWYPAVQTNTQVPCVNGCRTRSICEKYKGC